MTKVPQFKTSGQENSFWDYSILLTMWKIWSLGAPEEWHKTVTATSFSGIWRTLWPTSVSQNRPKVSVSCWRLYTATPGVYMRRINCDSATVNISFFIYISLKTMRLGVLWWEKLKSRESQGRIVLWAWTSLGVEEQLLIFSSCLSPGRVKKIYSV